MEDNTFNALLKRYEEGRCTPEEAARVEEWFHAVARHAPEPDTEPDYPTLGRRLYNALGIPKRRRLFPYYAAAASVLVFLAFGIYWYTNSTQPAARLTSQYGEDALPGGNRATLTLADGRTITLDEGQEGIIVGDEDITYADGNAPVVILSEAEGSPAIETLVLTTPKGGAYQITLPDGTNVWLNAASTLKYPSRFSGKERVVELTGEAYFDVRQQTTDIRQQTLDNRQQTKENQRSSAQSALPAFKLPFKVVTQGQTVEVLGTQFNISAYPDEPETKTTLVEGSVAIRPHGASASWRIVPGEQGRLTDGVIEIDQVDVQIYTAWKNGDFKFKGTPLSQVLRQLERWYDIEVDYHDIPNDKIHGAISRDKKLSSILFTIEKVSGQKFQLSEGRLTLKE